MGDSIKELINAFNLNNYAIGGINTNFTVEGNKIIGLFAYNVNVARYLQRVGEEIIKQQYLSREVANEHYNLDCFPFVLNSEKKEYSGNVKKVKLADCDDKVIRNLKIHFANEFKKAVVFKMALLVAEAVQITKEEAREWIGETAKIGAIDESNPLRKHYLYCIAFDGKYLEEQGCSPAVFKLLRKIYIKEFDSRLEECGLKKADFYEDKDGVLYIKNVGGKVIENVAKYVKKEVAFDFRTPGTKDSKVENFKDVLSSLISKQVEKSIDFYDYDVFTDEEEIKNGNNFVLIPLTKTCDGQLESLKPKDMYKINAEYRNLVSDIRGKTAKPHVANYKNPVYGFSNGKIAEMLPKVMEFPIAYNERTGHFEFAADLGPSSKLKPESPRQGSVLPFSVSKTGVAVPGVVNANPSPSKSDQDPDGGYWSTPSSSQSVDVMKNSKRLSTSRESVDSGASGVDSKSESRLLRSESNLSDASTPTSIEDAEVYRPFSRSSSRRESRESYRNSM